MNVKGTLGEMDALYLVTEERKGGRRGVLVSLEAKGRTDDILEEQLLSQVRACFGLLQKLPALLTDMDRDLAIAMAVKAWTPSEVHVIEFDAVDRAQLLSTESLTVAKEVVYELTPAVPGIGW